jgi:hypothetical protein
VKLGQEADQVLQTAPQPINRPRHHHIELATGCRTAQRIELRALIAALGAANAVILVDLDDLTAHPAGNLAEFALLIGCRLVDGADAKVENRFAHGLPSSFETATPTMPRAQKKTFLITFFWRLEMPGFVGFTSADFRGV